MTTFIIVLLQTGCKHYNKAMLDLGFRAHDFGKFTDVESLAQTASSFLSPSCLHLAPYKVWPQTAKPLTDEWAKQTTKTLAKYNIRTAILGVYINPIHPDDDKREQELLAFENGIEIAHSLNNPIVATETGSADPKNIRCEETWSDKYFSLFLNNIERLLKKAQDNNVIMAIEAVADKNTIDTPQRMFKVMETFKSPNLRVLFDAVNILPIHGVDNFASYYDEAVSMLSPYISCMHLKDFVFQDSSSEFPFAKGQVKKGTIPIGEGIMPWSVIFDIYKKYNLLNVPMTMENFNPETLKDSIKFVNSLTTKSL